MTIANLIFFSTGTFCAILSGVFLVIWGMDRRRSTNHRILYFILGMFELYYGVVYGLVLFGFLAMSHYGQYIRPVAFISYLAPFLIAAANQKSRVKL